MQRPLHETSTFRNDENTWNGFAKILNYKSWFCVTLEFIQVCAHKSLNVIIGCSCKKCVKYHRQRHRVSALYISPLFQNNTSIEVRRFQQIELPLNSLFFQCEPWTTSQWTPTKLQSSKHFFELFTFQWDAWFFFTLIHPLKKILRIISQTPKHLVLKMQCVCTHIMFAMYKLPCS